ncbi:Acyl-CoA desaturase [Actinoplanes sp. SE50]|uniref:acyl-CoA desaturase n=1 Tax=unclassified Actinoplanes TaxID=2626549 RepID=UPI00023EC2F3|nr:MULTISPECIES: acyl-CoA desaturase [unclassified Actinoplanes]AEV85819.1 Acyl-CoA desaturase [Actinoplanes sp. SE50/110]ATO84215.1 Acyl-CoA desaturase [Actinoplanes sp. SE50]SLM01625.1 acyl-CoA desaturase [Actinoplanes sp. SE50/110]
MTVHLFVIVRFVALLAAVPFAWGRGLSRLDLALAVGWCTLTCLGTTAGHHRYFTHGSFKAGRPLRIGLAVAGSLAVQGAVNRPTAARLARITR